MSFTLNIGGKYYQYLGGNYQVDFKNRDGVNVITIREDGNTVAQYIPTEQVIITYHGQK